MDKLELIGKLKALHNHNDPEESHYIADGLLLDYINDEEVSAAFNLVPGWYA